MTYNVFGGTLNPAQSILSCKADFLQKTVHHTLRRSEKWFVEKLSTFASKVYTQPFCDFLDFIQDNPGEQVPEETFTHSHLSWSSIIPYLLPPFITIHGILSVQFMCLTVFFHNLFQSFLWSTSWPGTLHLILHTFFIKSLSSFRSTCPYHRNLCRCSTEIMSPNPSLSLNPLLGTLSSSLMSHIHLTLLISAHTRKVKPES